MKRIACFLCLVGTLTFASTAFANGRVVTVRVGGVGGCGAAVGLGHGYYPQPVAAFSGYNTRVGVGTYYQPTVSTFLYPYTPQVALNNYAPPVSFAAPPPCVCPTVPVGVPNVQYQPPALNEAPASPPPPLQTYSGVSTVGVGVPMNYGASYGGSVAVGVPSYGATYGGASFGGGYTVNAGRFFVPLRGGHVVRTSFAADRVFVPNAALRIDVKGRRLGGQRVTVKGGPVAGVLEVKTGRKGILERARERRVNRRAFADCPDPEFTVI